MWEFGCLRNGGCVKLSTLRDKTRFKVVQRTSQSRNMRATVPRKERPESTDMARYWLAAMLESSSDAFIAQTLDGLIIDWNKGASKLFGYRKGEMLGTPISRLIPRPNNSTRRS